MPSTQKKIRDIERLLRKEGLEEEKKAHLTAELQKHNAKSQQTATNLREKKLAIKYHKIKFFERRKLTRKINTINNKLLQISSTNNGIFSVEQEQENSSLSAARIQALEDLAYLMYYPKSEKFISLFGGKGRDKASHPEQHEGGTAKKEEAETENVSEVEEVDDAKTESRRQAFREAALCAWKLDQENGRDEVHRVLEAEGVREGGTGGASYPSSKKRGARGEEGQDKDREEGDSNREHPQPNKKGRGRGESRDQSNLSHVHADKDIDVVEERGGKGERGASQLKKIKNNKKNDNNNKNNKKKDDSHSLPSLHELDSSGEMEGGRAGNTLPASQPPVSSVPVPVPSFLDPFFVEEVHVSKPLISPPPSSSSSSSTDRKYGGRGGGGRGRNGERQYGQGWGTSPSPSPSSSASSSVSTGTVKQQARLDQWKQKQKMKKKNTFF